MDRISLENGENFSVGRKKKFCRGTHPSQAGKKKRTGLDLKELC